MVTEMNPLASAISFGPDLNIEAIGDVLGNGAISCAVSLKVCTLCMRPKRSPARSLLTPQERLVHGRTLRILASLELQVSLHHRVAIFEVAHIR